MILDIECLMVGVKKCHLLILHGEKIYILETFPQVYSEYTTLFIFTFRTALIWFKEPVKVTNTA